MKATWNTNRSPQENADLDRGDNQVDEIPEMLINLSGWITTVINDNGIGENNDNDFLFWYYDDDDGDNNSDDSDGINNNRDND